MSLICGTGSRSNDYSLALDAIDPPFLNRQGFEKVIINKAPRVINDDIVSSCLLGGTDTQQVTRSNSTLSAVVSGMAFATMLSSKKANSIMAQLRMISIAPTRVHLTDCKTGPHAVLLVGAF